MDSKPGKRAPAFPRSPPYPFAFSEYINIQGQALQPFHPASPVLDSYSIKILRRMPQDVCTGTFCYSKMPGMIYTSSPRKCLCQLRQNCAMEYWAAMKTVRRPACVNRRRQTNRPAVKVRVCEQPTPAPKPCSHCPQSVNGFYTFKWSEYNQKKRNIL